MTIKIENLRHYEAVKSGDTVIVQLPTSYPAAYMVGDRKVNGGQIAINKDETIYSFTAPKKTWIKTILKDGTELSAQEVNKIHNQYYDEDRDDIVYPSLEAEFEHRKELLRLGEGEKVYLEEEAILTPIEYTVVGELEDTGSPFIESAVVYGKGRFYTNDNSFYRLNTSGVIGDTLQKFAAENKLSFSNANHSGYLYAKIKDQYVIGSGSKWEKQSNDCFRYFPTATEAKKYEGDLRAELNEHLCGKFNTTVISKATAAQIFADVQGILRRVESLDVMRKAQDDKRYTVNAINALLKRLGEIQ